jgi:hypothetical protein
MSCCSPSHSAIGTEVCDIHAKGFHHEGCLKKFGQFVMDHAAVLGGAGIGIAFIQVNHFTLEDDLEMQIFIHLFKRFPCYFEPKCELNVILNFFITEEVGMPLFT